MHSQFDTVVIGGGIIGLSCGYYLSKSGKKVLVLDRAEFGAGASGACDDMILLQSKSAGIVLELAMESLRMYRGLGEELNSDLGFKQLGGMILIENQRDLSIMEEFVERQQACGLNVDIIGKEEMFRRQPNINRKYIASTYSADDSQVDPLHVMQAFIRAGKALGMEVRYQEGVIGIDRSGSGDWLLTTTSGGSIRTEAVVIAAGAWSGKIGAMLDIDIPVTPKRGQLLITEKIPPIGETNLWTAAYMVTKLRPDLAENAVTTGPAAAEGLGSMENSDSAEAVPPELGLGFSFTRTVDGNYLIGSTREKVGFDKQVSYAALQALSRQVVDIIPLMRHVHIIRHIAGFRPAVSDGRMLLGEWPGLDGLFVAAGHEGDGIAMAPITGKLLSDYVCGRPQPARIGELGPQRVCVSNE